MGLRRLTIRVLIDSQCAVAAQQQLIAGRALMNTTQLHRYTDEQVAHVCHEANRALQAALDDPLPSQPWWVETEHTRESAIHGVRAARSGRTPRQLHEEWVSYKAAAGWVYGPRKDPLTKTHPCMVPYDELPQREKDKDALFHAIVGALTI